MKAMLFRCLKVPSFITRGLLKKMIMNKKLQIAVVAPSTKVAFDLTQGLVSAMQCSLYDICIIAPDLEFTDHLKRLNIQVLKVPRCSNCSNIFSALGYILSLRKIFRRLKADIVLGCNTESAAYGSIAARVCGVGSIISLITEVDHLPYLHNIGLRCSHKVIFQDYNDRYVFDLFGLGDNKRAVVVNGCCSERACSEKANQSLINAMGLKR